MSWTMFTYRRSYKIKFVAEFGVRLNKQIDHNDRVALELVTSTKDLVSFFFDCLTGIQLIYKFQQQLMMLTMVPVWPHP